MAGPSPAGRAGQATQTTHGSGGTAQARFHAEFACVQCADDVTRALAASPHITAFHVDYPRHEVAVTYHVGVITPDEIQAMISSAAHGCRCVADRGPSDTAERAKPSGGDLAALGHGADMAAITQGTTADRMQYEFPHTSGAQLHNGKRQVSDRREASGGGGLSETSGRGG